MSNLTLRRSLVTLATVIALLGGAWAIRAAAAWTASAAPLTERPADALQLATQLQAEQDRAAALGQQLAEVTARAAELQAALDAARHKADADAASAAGLTTQLAGAQARLAELQRQMASIGQQPAGLTMTTIGGAHLDDSDDGEDDEAEYEAGEDD